MTDAILTGATRRWPVISALGVVMIFTWGSTYYLMTVLAAAPVLGAWVIASTGPAATLWILAALALANAGILALLWRSIRV
jgi:hypothetical protein